MTDRLERPTQQVQPETMERFGSDIPPGSGIILASMAGLLVWLIALAAWFLL